MSPPSVRAEPFDSAQDRPVEALSARLAAAGIHTLLVQFADIHGTAKGKLVPLAQLPELLATGAGFAGPSIWGTGLPRTGPRSEYYARGVRLSDTRLAFNGSAAGTGSFARVAETVFDTDTGTLLGNMNVFSNAGPPPSEQLSEEKDWAAINQNGGYRSFELNKNIKMFANTDGGFAVCSFVRQDFSQIPGPGAFALLGFAGAVAGRGR